MARFYSNENVAAQLVNKLRESGHDVLRSFEAGKANAAVPDREVLAFAAAENRILVSHNRRHFLRLHQHRAEDHCGIVICSVDLDFEGQAERIHQAVIAAGEMKNKLVRVNRGT